MRRNSNRTVALAVAIGTGIGIGAGALIFNERLRHQLGRKMRRLGRACRDRSEDLRDTANWFIEKSGRNLKGARDTGRKVYSRLAG